MVFELPGRLPGKIKSASDEVLKRSSDWCEQLEFFCGGLVIAGLLVEVVIAVAHPSYDSFWDRWGSVVADILVAVGVIGEVFFSSRGSKVQGELMLRSNAKLEYAIDRAAKLENEAAEARLETERLKKEVSWRTIDADTSSRLVKELSRSPSDVTLVFVSGDPESTEYCAQLWKIFKKAGWNATVAGRIFLGPQTGISVTTNLNWDADIQRRIEWIRMAFTIAKLPYTPGGGARYSSEPGMGTGTLSSDVLILAGRKPPPFM